MAALDFIIQQAAATQSVSPSVSGLLTYCPDLCKSLQSCKNIYMVKKKKKKNIHHIAPLSWFLG